MTKWMENNNIDIMSRQLGFDIPVSEEQSQKGLRGYEYWIKVNEDTTRNYLLLSINCGFIGMCHRKCGFVQRNVSGNDVFG